jgi:RNA polymerase sigma-70 factor (ECF subfamily)
VDKLDERARELVADGDVGRAVVDVLRAHGPEVMGFLVGVLRSEHDADDVFSAVSTRLWRSLGSFEWRCTLRTWIYVIARREIARYRSSNRRFLDGRVPISEIEDVVKAITSEAHRTHRSTARSDRLASLRDELSEDDRALLVLRVDRALPWEDVALAFVEDPESASPADLQRESARLRKRFQLVKSKLATRAREEGLV